MGLTRAELIEKLDDIDPMLLSDLQWTEGARALGHDGQSMRSALSAAACWGLQSAGFEVARDPAIYTQIVMSLSAAINQPQITVGEFNDASTFADIKQLLHKAREIAKTEEPWTATLPDRLK